MTCLAQHRHWKQGKMVRWGLLKNKTKILLNLLESLLVAWQPPGD